MYPLERLEQKSQISVPKCLKDLGALKNLEGLKSLKDLKGVKGRKGVKGLKSLLGPKRSQRYQKALNAKVLKVSNNNTW